MTCFWLYLILSISLSALATHGVQVIEATENVTSEIALPRESCEQSAVQQNVSLRGGINAGIFRKLAQYVAMQLCIKLCCEHKGCDVALMSGKNCYGVQCFSEELCQAISAKKAPSSLMIAHVTIKGERADSTKSEVKPRNLKCNITASEEGVTLRGGLKAGTFTDVGKVDGIDSCTRLCCVAEKCDLSLLIKNNCFIVSCFTEDLCKTVKARTKNYRPTIAFVRRETTEVTRDSEITLSYLPATNSKMMCKNSDIYFNHTLKGGYKAGMFTDLGKVADMPACIRMCCGRKQCDVALMLEKNCYAVHCSDQELCNPVHARHSSLLANLNPKLSYITSRNEEVLPKEIVINRDTTCKPSVISYDVTLKGGLNAGNFTPTGTVDSMETCARRCCESQSCDVAFMLKDSCYMVGCASEELCEEVPAPSSAYYPRLSFVRRGPKNDRTLLHKKNSSSNEHYCTNSEVMTNVTLRGGITAGKFRDRGKIKHVKECVNICCLDKSCDLAFLLRNNCFSVSCFNEQLCEVIKAKSSDDKPKLVYIYARTQTEPATTKRGKQIRGLVARSVPGQQSIRVPNKCNKELLYKGGLARMKLLILRKRFKQCYKR